MNSKLLFNLVLVLAGLGVSGFFASGKAQSRLPGPANSQFIISTNADGGTATITGYAGASGEVIVPDRINGLTVASIGARAFWANPAVTSVVIPDSITNIREEAFSAVDSHSSLTNVVVGNGVITIGRRAFHFCDKLTNVKIPRHVSHIGNSAFAGCFGLKSIIVDSNNTAYCSVDGVLFNKSETELVQYPPGKAGNYAIPSTVTNIADYALWNCPKLTSVIIPEGITTLKKEAFAACSSLTSITIPASVTNIDIWAFNSCGSLKGVYFRGNAPGHREYHGYKGVDIYHIFSGNDQAIVYYLPGSYGLGKDI
jgi:hypothetical protein